MAAGTYRVLDLYALQRLRTHASSKVGFFGVTPVVRAAAYVQTFNTPLRTTGNMTAAAVATTAATQSTPWGFSTQAQADAIVANLNALRLDVSAVKQNITSIIDDLQAYGLAQ